MIDPTCTAQLAFWWLLCEFSVIDQLGLVTFFLEEAGASLIWLGGSLFRPPLFMAWCGTVSSIVFETAGQKDKTSTIGLSHHSRLFVVAATLLPLFK
jgi:hypothetical protein